MGKVDTEFSSSSFGKNGSWLDSPDLSEKYKNKPTQLTALKKNAEKLWHPERECWLYKDAEFSSKEEAGTSHTKRLTSETKQEDKKAYRPAKQPKVEKAAENEAGGSKADQKAAAKAAREAAAQEKARLKAEEAEAKKRKPLTEAQRKKMDKLLGEIDKAVRTGVALVDRANAEPDLKSSAPANVPQGCVLNAAGLEEQIASINMAKAEGWVGEGKKVLDEATDALETAKRHLDKFERWVDDFDSAA